MLAPNSLSNKPTDPKFQLDLLTGRIGESIVSTGLTVAGFEVFPTGIEHTNFSEIYACKNNKKDPLFQQLRKIPDFIAVSDERHYFIEAKFRTKYFEKGFCGDLQETYLGKERRQNGDLPGTIYFGQFDHIFVVLVCPDKVRIARLNQILNRRGVNETITWNNCFDSSDPSLPSFPAERWKSFETHFAQIQTSLGWNNSSSSPSA